MTIEILTKY